MYLRVRRSMRIQSLGCGQFSSGLFFSGFLDCFEREVYNNYIFMSISQMFIVNGSVILLLCFMKSYGFILRDSYICLLDVYYFFLIVVGIIYINLQRSCGICFVLILVLLFDFFEFLNLKIILKYKNIRGVFLSIWEVL